MQYGKQIYLNSLGMKISENRTSSIVLDHILISIIISVPVALLVALRWYRISNSFPRNSAKLYMLAHLILQKQWECEMWNTSRWGNWAPKDSLCLWTLVNWYNRCHLWNAHICVLLASYCIKNHVVMWVGSQIGKQEICVVILMLILICPWNT